MFDLEPRQIIYNRAGNLSQSTTLNSELANQFMRISDLRRDIVITDSAKQPEKSSTQVGSDILAWRGAAPLSELTRVTIGSRKFHQLDLVDNQYQLQIHDKVIDDYLRTQRGNDRNEYTKLYLKLLQKSVKKGAQTALRWEKLGFKDQWLNYSMYFIPLAFWAPLDLKPNPQSMFFQFTLLMVMYHIKNHLDNFLEKNNAGRIESLPPGYNPRDSMHSFMPIVPVDKWFKGQRFLAEHGQNLVIAR